ALGESVTEATVGQWFKKPGDAVNADEPLLELETDKVTLEVPAPVAGVLADIVVPQGSTVAVGAVLGRVREGDGAATKAPAGGTKNHASEPAAQQGVTPTRLIATPPAQSSERSGPVAPPATALKSAMPPSPSARKLMEESKVSAEDVAGSGRRGQILKEDVLAAAARAAASAAPAEAMAHATPPLGTAVPRPRPPRAAPPPPH